MREWGWAEELCELCVEGGEDVEEREEGLCVIEWEGLLFLVRYRVMFLSRERVRDTMCGTAR